jgi:hypothetical protein
MRWFPLDDLPDKLVPNVAQVLEQYQQGEYYSERIARDLSSSS